MKKIILGMAGGIALLSTIFLWPTNTTSASEGFEDLQINGTQEIDISVLVYALEKAEEEIEDEELKGYYRKLIDSYNLEESESSEDGSLAADVLPDVDHIVRTAIALPLQEAGKNINDPEIKEFYEDFLKDVGWEFD